MSNPSLSFRFAIFLSFSFTASSSLPPPFFSKHSSPRSPSIPKATPSDLFSVLGAKPQSSAVNPIVAKELKSCFKFLVPFTPTGVRMEPSPLYGRRQLGFTKFTGPSQREQHKLIWWPPEPVLELARFAVDSGGDPAAIQRLLDPTMIPVSLFYPYSPLGINHFKEYVFMMD